MERKDSTLPLSPLQIHKELQVERPTIGFGDDFLFVVSSDKFGRSLASKLREYGSKSRSLGFEIASQAGLVKGEVASFATYFSQVVVQSALREGYEHMFQRFPDRLQTLTDIFSQISVNGSFKSAADIRATAKFIKKIEKENEKKYGPLKLQEADDPEYNRVGTPDEANQALAQIPDDMRAVFEGVYGAKLEDVPLWSQYIQRFAQSVAVFFSKPQLDLGEFERVKSTYVELIADLRIKESDSTEA